MPSEYRLGLDDLLFRYGIRIQPNLVLDMQCTGIKLVTGQMGDQPQLQSFDYPYHLSVTPDATHPVVKSLGLINLLYPSSIDTAVRTKTDIRRTVLLRSTPRSRYQLLPLRMDFDFMRYPLDPAKFDKGPQPLALLLEGQFPSMYENRLTQDMKTGLERLGAPFRALSPYNRMIVVSDGDIARNAVNRQSGEIIPLGYNRFTGNTFDNKDFLLNAIEYLLDDAGVVEARGKNVDLRLLDSTRAQAERGKWRLLNLAAPLVGLLLFGTAYQALRRRRYGRA
jgi:gliding-associated putative ABC transporter substrate-binding component GldG